MKKSFPFEPQPRFRCLDQICWLYTFSRFSIALANPTQISDPTQISCGKQELPSIILVTTANETPQILEVRSQMHNPPTCN